MDENIVNLAKYRLEKAKEALSSAKLAFDKNLLRPSLSASYYSIFHSARTLLVFKKLDSKSHSGLITLFNREFIKNGLLSEKFKDVLSKAFYIRIESDYEDFYVASRDEAQEQIENAKFFLNEIIRFVKEHYQVDLEQ